MAQEVRLFPYQERTVNLVLEDLGGNAIIADEVGLGKTIEAGAVIERILSRDPHANVLVLAPHSILTQWRSELLHRFDRYFELEDDVEPLRMEGQQSDVRLIASHSKLSRGTIGTQLSQKRWELVVVDEAHKFSNSETKRYALLTGLNRAHTILLTATPVQNHLLDLYFLGELVNPGAMARSPQEFLDDYSLTRDGREVRDSTREVFRRRLARILTRTTRGDAGVFFAPRHVSMIPLMMRPAEHELQALVFSAIRNLTSSSKQHGRNSFLALSLHQAFSSHPLAVIEMLRDLSIAETEVLTKMQALAPMLKSSSKVTATSQLLAKEGPTEKWLIFVERILSGRLLTESLREHGFTTEFYHGALELRTREKILAGFRGTDTQVLVATSAGGEGLNLQHCRNLVNYDLHWNPLKIEQRIGRIHRLGQAESVRIFNLVLKNSLDEALLDRIFTKIDLFTMTIGKMATIIGGLEGEMSLDEELERAAEVASTPEQLREGFSKAGDRLSQAVRREEEFERNQPI